MRRLPAVLAFAMLAFGLALAPRLLVSRTSAAGDFVHFESGHVRPATLTPSGNRLLVVNTSDDRLAVFDLTGALPVRVGDIPVGLEPISVAALSDDEAWVVNQLSDDVSIVNLTTMNVRATLRVGDEPGDVVFAGSPLRAYVSVSQEDVIKVYDPATLAPSGLPIAIDGRMPRALARNADGSRVFAAVFHAGNRTSVLSFQEALDSLPPPNPPMSGSLPPAPHVGLIVQRQGDDWRDESGKLWNSKIKYDVFDTDVVEIRTSDNAVVRSVGGIGTINFGLAVSPAGTVAVTATEARNLTRFEPNLRGHNVDTRAALVGPGGAVTLCDLNRHVNYSVTPGTQAERDSALGIPTGAAWSGDGQRLYVTSLASNRLGVLDPAAPPANAVLSRPPTVAGPTGVVVDDARGRLYVVGRFRNQLETLSTADFSSLGVARIGFDPTPDAIVNGRKFFYGGFTSGHGEHACASCHVFGDFDNIAWDLGDPAGVYQAAPPGQIDPALEGFHPMKGPMTTQSLRGLPGTGLLHWRGDRADLAAFNPAFIGLLGRATSLPDSEMAAFADFVMPLVYPPNPRELLDRTMPDAPVGQPSALRGQQFFLNTPVDAFFRCTDCHTATNFGPGTNGQIINDAALGEDQDIKIPQLRNMYKKTGFTDLPGAQNKRGFGFIHDGSVDNLFDFLLFPGFNFGANANAKRRDVEAFLLSFDTGMAPAVGNAITFNGPNNSDLPLIARMTTLEQQFTGNHCEVIAKGRLGGTPRSWLYQGAQQWKPDLAGQPNISSADLRALGGPGSEVTVMGVPPGSGQRMGLDRDRDTYFDADEIAAGSDPGDPRSTPLNVGVPPGQTFAFQGVRPNPFRSSAEILFTLSHAGAVDCAVYDVLGRRVASLARARRFEAGPQRLVWTGRTERGGEAAAGVYFVRLRTEAGASMRTVVRVR